MRHRITDIIIVTALLAAAGAILSAEIYGGFAMVLTTP